MDLNVTAFPGVYQTPGMPSAGFIPLVLGLYKDQLSLLFLFKMHGIIFKAYFQLIVLHSIDNFEFLENINIF